MTLMKIQHAAESCASLAGSKLDCAAAWAGHNVQAIGRMSVNAGKSFCDGIALAALKCAAFVKAIFSSACMYANMGWQVGKYLGARSWEAAKIGGAYGLEKASLVSSKILSGGSSALEAISGGANALKCGALRMGAVSMQKISQFGLLAKDAAAAGGRGALRGVEITRSFAAAHPKEILLVGGVLVVSLAIGCAAARVFNPPEEIA